MSILAFLVRASNPVKLAPIKILVLMGMVKLAFQPEFARFTNLARGANGRYDD